MAVAVGGALGALGPVEALGPADEGAERFGMTANEAAGGLWCCGEVMRRWRWRQHG